MSTLDPQGMKIEDCCWRGTHFDVIKNVGHGGDEERKVEEEITWLIIMVVMMIMM